MKGFMDIPGYEGLYAVSMDGQVWSHYYNKTLTPKKHPAGYLRVTLCKGIGHHKTISIHRLVAMAFIPNPLNKPTVNHINEIKDDNRVENLEWATVAEQNAHGTRTERATKNTDWKARNIDYKIVASKHDYSKQTMCNRKRTRVIKDGVVLGEFNTQREASNFTGVSASKVSQCVSGDKQSCKGFQFEEVEP